MRLTSPIQRGLGPRRALAAALFAATAAGIAAPSSVASSPGDLGAGITTLQSQVTRLQVELGAERRHLLRIRVALEAAQTKLARLESAKAAAERVLAEQLVGSFEGGRPDIVTVVLESNGFMNLLERVAFAQRVSRQEARVVAYVRAARRAVATEAATLGQLAAHAQNMAESVLAERDQLARSRLTLVASQLASAKAPATAPGQLAAAQGEVGQLTQQLARLHAVRPGTPLSSASATAARGISSGAGVPFPLPAANAAPPATWALGDGVSIAAPAGTPDLALCSGTIVLHGIGGLGPSAPVLRCNQPLAGYSYVYYGYAGPTQLAAIGANVARGQPLARVGVGTVGFSTGPHLEIGFADASGAPLGSATARQMLTLLRAAHATWPQLGTLGSSVPS